MLLLSQCTVYLLLCETATYGLSSHLWHRVRIYSFFVIEYGQWSGIVFRYRQKSKRYPLSEIIIYGVLLCVSWAEYWVIWVVEHFLIGFLLLFHFLAIYLKFGQT